MEQNGNQILRKAVKVYFGYEKSPSTLVGVVVLYWSPRLCHVHYLPAGTFLHADIRHMVKRAVNDKTSCDRLGGWASEG